MSSTKWTTPGPRPCLGRAVRRRSQAPANDKEWAAIRNNTLILAESGNLLIRRTPKADNGDWKRFSRQLTNAGAAALAAANSKDIDKLSGDVSDQLLNACETCQVKYLKKEKVISARLQISQSQEQPEHFSKERGIRAHVRQSD